MLASGALQFAFEKATTEGKITITALGILSLISWSIIFKKTGQLYLARKQTKKFIEAFNAARDPLALKRQNLTFEGAPAYHLYSAGAEELEYQLENNPLHVQGKKKAGPASLSTVRVLLEETSGVEAMALEKGMIVLSTAVAGGPFIGLLGTVWGVMETFAGIARANSASLTAMAPGVAGALIATVIGLLVAIPAMFAYNFMVTSIRVITQELDGFAARYLTAIEHQYGFARPLSEELKEANTLLAEKIVSGITENQGVAAK